MKYIIILFLLLNITVLNAQKQMNYTRKELKTKSKVELIEIAKNLLEEKHPEIALNINDFNIKIWSNEYGIVKVIFSRAIRYPSDITEDICYDITVNLDTKEIIPFDNKDLVFYTSSKKADSTIEYLKRKGLLPKNNQLDIEYTITENKDYYLVSCFDNLYHIDKDAIDNENHPYLSKTLVNKKTDETLFFKGRNPYYYLTLITFEDYYHDNLYTILKEENTSANKIIEIASSILKEKQPDLEINPANFEIVILGNYKDLIVKYRRFIRFEKNNHKAIFDIAVNIITEEVFPFNSPEDSFYMPSLSDEKAINTIQNIVPLECYTNVEHTISENEDYFWVASLYEKTKKKFFIDKKNDKVIWVDESYNLPINNREDLSLQEHYKRMNRSFDVKSENNKPLIDMALEVLKEEQFIPNISINDYNINVKASKCEVDVYFTRLVEFIPLRFKDKQQLEYNLNIGLVSKTIHTKPAQFYIPTKEDSITSDFVKNKIVKYIKDFNPTYFPLEIIEEKDYFTITTAKEFDLKIGTRKNYRMDKKTKTIEVVLSPTNFFPTPAMKPPIFNEIKD